MIKGILFVLLVATTLISVALLAFALNNVRRTNVKSPLPKVMAGALVLSAALLFTIPGSFHQVETGTVAVVKKLGKISGVRNPGTHFDFYMINEYEIYDAKVQQDKIVTSAYSKDGQTMDLEVFLQYQIQTENVERIATEYGSLDALQARIETVTVEKTKAVMSSAEAMTIIQNRASFSDDVSISVRAGISSDYYVNVKDVVLTNINFTSEFEKSVEDKVIAEQEKQAAITRAEAELEVARIEAERKITEAQGNAEAKKIIATAEAEAQASKIIELAKSLGYGVDTTYTYTTTVVEEGEGTYSKTVTENISAVKLEEASKVETIGTIVKTTTISLLSTKSVINYDTDHKMEDLDKLVISYLEYLAYLDKWDGKLPEVVSDSSGISIIVPNN